jgi:NAD(P)H dehydrogenase (quinone)
VGVPEQLARHLTDSFADLRDGQLNETSTDLQALLGRPPATLEKGLAELFAPAARGQGRR